MITEDLIPFDYIWNMAVQEVSDTVLNEVDQEFKRVCDLQCRPFPEWKAEVYSEYQRLREQLKEICYGPSAIRTPEDLLDGRKIASVLCSALISRKGFQFDIEKALEFTKEKKRSLKKNPVIFNQWAVKNVYINYKMAYFASLQLVYLTLMRDLLVEAGLDEKSEYSRSEKRLTLKQEKSRRLARLLNQEGHLCPYPRPPRGDGFDVNVIVGLARTDMSANDLDMFLFAMQLYQIEEHTKDYLERKLIKEGNSSGKSPGPPAF